MDQMRGIYERAGVGVRRSVGCGTGVFSASTVIAPDEVARLARDAGWASKGERSRGHRGIMTWDDSPLLGAHGRRRSGSIHSQYRLEEKNRLTLIIGMRCSVRAGVELNNRGIGKKHGCNSSAKKGMWPRGEGALFTQTTLRKQWQDVGLVDDQPTVNVHRTGRCGESWELFLDAKIPDQFPDRQARARSIDRTRRHYQADAPPGAIR